MADDYAASSSTTGRLVIGASISGVLESTGDRDWFRVSLAAGLTYEFNVTPAADFTAPSTLSMEMRRADGTALSIGSRGLQYIDLTSPSSATYYIDVGADRMLGTGAYTLNSTPLDDYTSGLTYLDAAYAGNGNTGRLALGSAVTGALESLVDVDWFEVSLTAGLAYHFEVTTASGLADRLDLLDRFGNRVGGGFLLRTLDFTPETSGAYYLSVSGNGSSTGPYTVRSNRVGGSGGGPGGGAGAGAGATVAVYRFFDSRTGTQFLTADASERDAVLATRPDLISEGVGLGAAKASEPNAAEVFRFFDSMYGTHFFTSSAGERDSIQATRPDLTYEGIGFYEYVAPQTGAVPVYRFFDSTYGTHFFTSSPAERSSILATRPDLVAEGIAFYAPAAV